MAVSQVVIGELGAWGSGVTSTSWLHSASHDLPTDQSEHTVIRTLSTLTQSTYSSGLAQHMVIFRLPYLGYKNTLHLLVKSSSKQQRSSALHLLL